MDAHVFITINIVFLLFILIIVSITLILIQKNHDHKKNIDKMHNYKFAIMAIFKNEHEYLEEWLDHHINQGVSHFYLYSNDSHMENYPYLYLSNNTKYTKYTIYTKYITLIQWTDKYNNGNESVQRQAYKHCVQTFISEFDYVMMLDIDEFLMPTDNRSVLKIIESYDLDTTKALKIQRYNYGSNGHHIKPSTNVIDSYTMREDICSSYKTIANSRYIDYSLPFYGVHDFNFIDINDDPGKVYNSYLSYGHNGYPAGCSADSVNEIPLVINHYYTKSYDEYLKRCKLWENKDNRINLYGVRKDCENMFRQNDHKQIFDRLYHVP